jgi:hypothetical protein
MRFRMTTLAGLALLAACQQDGFTASDAQSVAMASLINTSTTTANRAPGQPGGRPSLTDIFSKAPDSLKLSTDQVSAIQAKVTAFESANSADIATLDGLRAEAQAAMKAGATREAVRAILEKGKEVKARVDVAAEALRGEVDAILSASQLAWLKANKPPMGPGGPGGPGGPPPGGPGGNGPPPGGPRP